MLYIRTEKSVMKTKVSVGEDCDPHSQGAGKGEGTQQLRLIPARKKNQKLNTKYKIQTDLDR